MAGEIIAERGSIAEARPGGLVGWWGSVPRADAGRIDHRAAHASPVKNERVPWVSMASAMRRNATV